MKKKFSVVMVFMLTIIMCIGVIGIKNVKAVENDQFKPIHSYIFDNDSGNSVIDSGSMAGEEGKFNGLASGAEVIKENENTFRRFNGTSDYIQFNDSIIPHGKKTVEFKIRGNVKPPTGKYMLIFDNCNVDTSNSGIYCSIDDAGRLGIVGLDSSGNWNDTNFSIGTLDILDGKWHTISLTYDGTTNEESIKLYVDDLTNPFSKVKPKRLEKTYSKNLNISKQISGLLAFQGDLKDIKIYDEVVDYAIQAESITLDKTAIDLLKGNTDKLTATVLPENASNKKVVWSSSDETIATVDQEGNVTAVKSGQADITAKVDGTDLSATCKVIVTEKEPEPEPTPGKAILSISLVDGKTKDYDLSMEEVNKFINWYETERFKYV